MIGTNERWHQSLHVVMAGLVPAIHVLATEKERRGRPGHDEAGTIAPQADNFFAAASSLSSTMRCTIAIVS
jgi:hypothetical protein